ncbi:fimbrial protein [Salmonella enterica]|uniref:fimbrial protein n=1 Tax=Salmonella enterica TaxID=28901 RepID=UPI0009AAAAC6|nr:fimbrial protein [Salmonella enterica]
MNTKLLALSVILSASVSTSAFALDGGQLNFAGLVSDNTCDMHVDGGAQDKDIQLSTASVAEVNTAGDVNLATLGAKPKLFSITVDCSNSGMDLTAKPNATMVMSSQFYSNSRGTLNNDTSINNPSSGVNLAIHNVKADGTFKQVKVNDPADEYTATFNTSGVASWNFAASYVTQNKTLVPVVAGFVKSNAAYTITYP